MTLPANLDPNKMYVTPSTTQPTYVHSAQGEQFAVWSPTPLRQTDMLEVTEDRILAASKLGQSGQWIQVRDAQGHTGWVNGGKVQGVNVNVPGMGPTTGSTPISSQPNVPGKAIMVHTTLSNGQWVRGAANLNSAIRDDVTPTDKLQLLGNQESGLAKLGRYPEWVQVRTPKGIIGWAAAWYLERYPEIFAWTDGHALAGLHGPTETWADAWTEGAFQTVQQARVEAIKMLASNNLHQQPQMLANVIGRLRGMNVRFIMARMLAKFEQPRTPQDFADEVMPDVQALYNFGIRYFEVHNEPNLHMVPGNPEGMWVAWQNGAQFGAFFQQVVALFKPHFPDARFGFPGLSPAHEMPKQIYKAETFLTEADAAVRGADFVCMHTYWGPGGSDYLSSITAVQTFCKKYPDKLIIVSEFANSNPDVNKDVKGREYAMFYTQARKLPPNLGAVFSYALSSAGNDPDRMWLGSSIAQSVGARSLA